MEKPSTFTKAMYFLDKKGKKVRVLLVKDPKYHSPETKSTMVRQINNGKYYYVKAASLHNE